VHVTRFDIGRLGKAESLGAGGAKVPARIARTGIQSYRDSNGQTIREYRPPEEVFAADSLASLEAVPVTVGHPKDLVTPKTWKDHSHGVVLGAAERETVDGDEYVVARLALATADTLARVDAGELTEISCGYSCDVLDRPGVAPNGERYDRVQTNIRFNHVALGPTGFARAGRKASFKLDGSDMVIRYDGKEFNLESAPEVASLQKAIDEAAKVRADGETALGAALARADSAEKQARELQESFPTRVDCEIAFRDSVRPILGADFKFDGKSHRDVQLAAIAKLNPAASVRADASDEFVAAYFEATLASGAKPTETIKRVDASETRTDAQAVWDAHIKRTYDLFNQSPKVVG
jgi:hypothetical protein